MGVIILDDVEVGRVPSSGKRAYHWRHENSPGSLVLGSPAKIRRQLTLEEQKESRVGRGATSNSEAVSANFAKRLATVKSDNNTRSMKTITGLALATLLSVIIPRRGYRPKKRNP